jgi:hypothetical protein
MGCSMNYPVQSEIFGAKVSLLSAHTVIFRSKLSQENIINASGSNRLPSKFECAIQRNTVQDSTIRPFFEVSTLQSNPVFQVFIPSIPVQSNTNISPMVRRKLISEVHTDIVGSQLPKTEQLARILVAQRCLLFLALLGPESIE